MTRIEFFDRLKNLISEYPAEETQKSVEYYEEMIADRMEDGMTEDEAIASLGKVEDIAQQIKCELPLTTLVKQKAKEKTDGKKIPVWVIVLLILGAPLWLSVGLSIAATVVSIYASIWSVIISLWAFDLSLAISAVACIPALIVMAISGAYGSALIYTGLGLTSAALAIFLYLACFYISKGVVVGTGWIFKQIKKSIVGNKEV